MCRLARMNTHSHSHLASFTPEKKIYRSAVCACVVTHTAFPLGALACSIMTHALPSSLHDFLSVSLAFGTPIHDLSLSLFASVWREVKQACRVSHVLFELVNLGVTRRCSCPLGCRSPARAPLRSLSAARKLFRRRSGAAWEPQGRGSAGAWAQLRRRWCTA